MKISAKIIAALFVLVVVIIIAIQSSASQPEHIRQTSASLTANSLIEISVPRRQDFTETCQWFGKVENTEKIDVIVLKSGWVDSVDVGDEMFVSKGTRLFTLSDPMIDSRLEAVKKKVISLQEGILLSERRINTRKDSVSLEPSNQKGLVVAQDSLFDLQTELESAEQEMHFLQDAVHIRATADGVFTNRQVSAGQVVEKGDKLAEIVSVKHFRVVATLFPSKNTELEGKQAIIDLAEGNSISGIIVKQLQQRTTEGATIVWIESPEVDHRLRPGETVNGELILSKHKGVLSIPQSAVVQDEEGRAYVFLRNSEGFHKQPIKTGLVTGGWIEIISGIMEKDTVVIQGAYELFYRDFNKIYKVKD